MFAPDWDAACAGCSFTADHLDGAVAHLAAAGVTFVAVSRAPLEKDRRLQAAHGLELPRASSFGSEFNFDFGVSFTPEQQADEAEYNYRWNEDLRARMPELPEATGMSAFALEQGVVYHTYSAYDRGTDVLSATWQLLDRVPHGRRDDLGWLRRELRGLAGIATPW